MTTDKRGRSGKIKVAGVDDSVMTWMMFQCLEEGGEGRRVLVAVLVGGGLKMLRWS